MLFMETDGSTEAGNGDRESSNINYWTLDLIVKFNIATSIDSICY